MNKPKCEGEPIVSTNKDTTSDSTSQYNDTTTNGRNGHTPLSDEGLLRHVLGDDEGRYFVTLTGRQARLENPRKPDGEPTPAGELIQSGKNGITQKSWRYPDELPEALDYLRGESGRGRDAYFAVAPFKEGGNRRATNVTDTVSSLRLDFDGYKTTKPPDFPEPTARAESSPGSYHEYFKLSRPVEKWFAQELSRRLAHWCGCDLTLAANTTIR